MSEHHEEQEGRPLVSMRALDIGTAVFFIVVGVIVLYDSNRLGFNWRPNEGPAPGYFPFYIAVVMILASLFNLYNLFRQKEEGREMAVSVEGFKRMAAVFAPALVYVFLINYLGIYVTSAAYIAGFMVVIGKFNILKAAAVGIGFAVVAFTLFEIWFLVPLPKGPLEAALGF